MTDKESLQFIIDTFNDLSQKPQDIGLMFKFCDAHSRVKKSLERLNHIESSLKIFIEKLKKDRDKEIRVLEDPFGEYDLLCNTITYLEGVLNNE